MDFFTAYTLTITIECVVLYFLVRKQYLPVDIIRNGVIASTITLPFVWLVFPNLGLQWTVMIGLSEAFAIVIEGFCYRFMFEKMSLLQGILISLICNLISFGIGLVLS